MIINQKLGDYNGLISVIKCDILYSLSIDDIIRYYIDHPEHLDYKIAQEGNLLFYYDDIVNLFKENNISVSDCYFDEIWREYNYFVGVATRRIISDFKMLQERGVI